MSGAADPAHRVGAVHRDVAAVIERWRRALAARDADRLRLLWDHEYGGLSFLPTERPEVLTTWEQISAYYDQMCAGGPISELSLTGLMIDPIGEVDAFAFAYVTQVSTAAGVERRWQGRVQFHLRRIDGAWRLVHYEDSTDLPQAAAFVLRLQANHRAAIADAIRTGATELALTLLEGLAQPPPLSSAAAVASGQGR